MAGEFLQQFFEERQSLEFKSSGEADVLCPFPHDKGYETRPSAHVNVGKALFHCKTCRAEGRFNDGGLSEIGFVSQLYHISYAEAIQMLKMLDGSSVDEAWPNAVENLRNDADLLAWLDNRGIGLDAVIEYELGRSGAYGITYPVKINGVMVDKRTYDTHYKEKKEAGESGVAKIKSEAKAPGALFPYDHWKLDNRSTLLCAGENDALLARIKGFNGLTTTVGEGGFPKIFAGMFKDKNVYICYDCDEAGKQGSLKVAFVLREAGANVFIVNLGLAGTDEDKDVTDFFIKNKKTAADLQKLIDEAPAYSGEMYQQAKNENYPLVNLWEVVNGKWSGRCISSRVQVMGKYEQAMQVPTAIEWWWSTEEGSPHPGDHGWWAIEDKQLGKVLELIEIDKNKQHKLILSMFGVPDRFKQFFHYAKREKKHVWKVILSPDVETEDELTGFRMAEHIAYVIANDLEDGQKYRVFMRPYPHPKSQAIVSVIDRVEQSDNAINTFKLTDDIKKQLTQFQGDPFEQSEKRWELAKQVVHPSTPKMVVEAVNIMYHSVLDFKFGSKLLNKGNPEGLVVGESRTGKTETSKQLQQFYGVGNFTNCKSTSAAGLQGGVTESNGMTGHRIRWGTVPRNNGGLVFLDELSGMPQQVISSLTYMRSERIAQIEKIASGKMPAKTRLMWISNPKTDSNGMSKPVYMYQNGIEIVTELIGSDEDIARFDFIVILPPNKVYISPLTEIPDYKVDRQPYRNLIYWAWSRKPEQVKYAEKVEEYIWARSQELNERYDTNVKLFGPEAYKKIARIAVSCAAMCFSNCDNGDSIQVRKEHVDFACDFLVRCYDNNVFRLLAYAEEIKASTTTNEEINTVFAGLVKSQGMLLKALSHGDTPMRQLEALSGIPHDQFNDAINNLYRHKLVQATKFGVAPTLRFRLAQQAYIACFEKDRLIPLTEQGVVPI